MDLGLGLESHDAREFVIRAEEHGIPQARHRVILLGVREDCLGNAFKWPLPVRRERDLISLQQVIGELPRLRSGVSKGDDSPEGWLSANPLTQADFEQEAEWLARVGYRISAR